MNRLREEPKSDKITEIMKKLKEYKWKWRTNKKAPKFISYNPVQAINQTKNASLMVKIGCAQPAHFNFSTSMENDFISLFSSFCFSQNHTVRSLLLICILLLRLPGKWNDNIYMSMAENERKHNRKINKNKNKTLNILKMKLDPLNTEHHSTYSN